MTVIYSWAQARKNLILTVYSCQSLFLSISKKLGLQYLSKQIPYTVMHDLKQLFGTSLNKTEVERETSASDEQAMAKNLSHSMSPVRLPIRSSSSNNSFGSAKSCHFPSITVTDTTFFDPSCQQQETAFMPNLTFANWLFKEYYISKMYTSLMLLSTGWAAL